MSTTGFSASPAKDWGELAERMRLLSERSVRFSQQIPQVQTNIREAQQSMVVVRSAMAEICWEVSQQAGMLSSVLVTLNEIGLTGPQANRAFLGTFPRMQGRVVNE
ncbi:hypothetical protein GTO91_07535 [Heliobacterium undosum]|uniref:Uncharacterized protein n=1 Tax=Heliomicrobium undosum TaxID=121734 RepID=A0A845L1Q1_9FIRM|nr:hypothetical protein [Heliomicrobium undosum]MZP29556.1 hypothetical protein [Heliomicrobium undosum]